MGIFLLSNGDIPIINGDIPIKTGDFPIKHGDFSIKHGYIPAIAMWSFTRPGIFAGELFWVGISFFWHPKKAVFPTTWNSNIFSPKKTCKQNPFITTGFILITTGFILINSTYEIPILITTGFSDVSFILRTPRKTAPWILKSSLQTAVGSHHDRWSMFTSRVGTISPKGFSSKTVTLNVCGTCDGVWNIEISESRS